MYNNQHQHYGYQGHYGQQCQHNHMELKNRVLSAVDPVVQYGMQESQHTSYSHGMTEVAAIAYLMGMGYNPMAARQMVESWEMNESFYPYGR